MLAGLPSPYAHQTRSFHALKVAYHQGARSVCVVLPTGGGKTLLGTMVMEGALRKGRRGLWLAHTCELVQQGYDNLAKLGVPVGFIKSGRASNPSAPIQVASVQTLTARPQDLPPADIIIPDECFVAGTLIDTLSAAKPIEQVRVGDIVTADDGTQRQVLAVMRRPVRELLRVHADGLSVVCTPEHPFLTARGWVPARELTLLDQVRTCNAEDYRNDLRAVFRPGNPFRQERLIQPAARAAGTAGLLLGGVREGDEATDLIGDDGANEPSARLRADDQAQPHVSLEHPGEDVEHSSRDRACSTDSRRERSTTLLAAADAGRGVELAHRGGGENASASRVGVSDVLQARHCEPHAEDRGRGGRVQSLRADQAGVGSQEGSALGWARVDRLEVLEPGSDGTFGGVCPDRCVYNFEVAERHTYVAGGFVVHNCHHVAAETWTALLGRYRSPELICGFTATPVRADGKPLGRASGGVFDAMVAKTSVVDLQNQLRPDGHPILVQCEVVGPGPDAPRNVLFRPALAGLREFGRDAKGRIRPTIMFVSSVREARDVAAQANAINIRAAAIDGTMSDAKREDAIRRYAQGELDLLTNVFVLTEGFDAPRTEVIALARQCQALSTFIQIIGRGLRSSPATGKKDCLLIDYCGMSYNHGLIETPREYSLEGRGITTSKDDLQVRQCPHCGGVDIPKPVCRRCGGSLAMPRPKAKVEVSNAQRIEENQLDSPSKKRAVFDGLCARARANGYASGWIGQMFKARYGHWPKFPLPITKPSVGSRARA